MDRLRTARFAKVQAALEASALEASGLGALVLFEVSNIRYATAMHVGNWARDRFLRCALVTRGEAPILRDIRSADRTRQIHPHWFDKSNGRTGSSSWRGSIPEHVGVGASNANWGRSPMSRYHSFEHPVELVEGMVFPIKTVWPTPDGGAAARIEGEVVVTADSCELMTRFPADQVYYGGTHYWTGGDLVAPACGNQNGLRLGTQA